MKSSDLERQLTLLCEQWTSRTWTRLFFVAPLVLPGPYNHHAKSHSKTSSNHRRSHSNKFRGQCSNNHRRHRCEESHRRIASNHCLSNRQSSGTREKDSSTAMKNPEALKALVESLVREEIVETRSTLDESGEFVCEGCLEEVQGLCS